MRRRGPRSRFELVELALSAVTAACAACLVTGATSGCRTGHHAGGEAANDGGALAAPAVPRAPERLAPLAVAPRARDEAPVVRRPPSFPSAGPALAHARAPRRIARLLVMSDLHVIDDESPERDAALDAPEDPFRSAARPQDAWTCRIANAAVRTANRMHADDPFDRVVVDGDTVDDAQANELAWALGVLKGGAPIACDSGAPDDPTPGPANDPKDPFVPEGLRAPWTWVTGNHDVLVQGTFPATPAEDVRARGARAAQGAREWSHAGGAVVRGPVVADARRALLGRSDLAAALGVVPREGRLVAAVDVGSRVRLLALDSAAETGGAGGVLRRSDVDGWLRPELARAGRDRKWVVVAMHHPIDLLGDGSSPGGLAQADAVPAHEIEELLAASPVVVAVLAGHLHTHRVRRVRSFWEITTAAIVDEPGELRTVEIWDEGGGLGTIRSSVVPYATDGDPIAARGRELAREDRASGAAAGGDGTPTDRNVALWFVEPP